MPKHHPRHLVAWLLTQRLLVWHVLGGRIAALKPLASLVRFVRLSPSRQNGD